MYEDIFNRLDSNYSAGNDISIQNEAKEELLKLCETLSDDEIGMVFHYSNGKIGTWPNIIEVLSKLGYPRIRKAIPKLLSFLEDVNWYGAEEAQQLLGSLDPNVYADQLEEKLKKALKSDIDWLIFIQLFIDEYNLRSYLNPDLLKQMDLKICKFYDEE